MDEFITQTKQYFILFTLSLFLFFYLKCLRLCSDILWCHHQVTTATSTTNEELVPLSF